MKKAGARMVARTPTLAMCLSTAYLLSKCGTPVFRLAELTEVKTRCTPAALAASAAATPCRVSASVPPPNGVVIAKREVAPSSALLIAAVSSSDAATSVAPAFASDFAWLESGSRVTARTWWPRSRRPRATAPPWLPVDPVTTTVSFCAMFWFLSAAPMLIRCLAGGPVSWHYVSHARDNRVWRRRALRTRGGAPEFSGSCGCIGRATLDGEPPDQRARARAGHASPPAHDAPRGAHQRG